MRKSIREPLLNRDLFVLNCVVSEIFERPLIDALGKVLKTMRAKAPTAQFLFLDRSDERTCKAVDALLVDAGLTKVHEDAVGNLMDSDEQKSAVVVHAQAIGRPRVQWQAGPCGTPAAFFVVAR